MPAGAKPASSPERSERAVWVRVRTMPNAPSQTSRFRSVWAVAVLAVAGASAWFAISARAAGAVQVDEELGIVSCVVDGLRYEYYGTTEREALYDVSRDRRCTKNIIEQHPTAAARCRAVIEKELGPEKLAELRERFARSRERLRALGYL
jgi:hypothetical protein